MSPAIVKISPSTSVPVRVVSSNEIEVAPTAVSFQADYTSAGLAFHKDAYMFTAIPVTACLLQYIDGSIRKPGLWTQANIVEPNRLIKDMERMGVQIKEKINSSSKSRKN